MHEGSPSGSESSPVLNSTLVDVPQLGAHSENHSVVHPKGWVVGFVRYTSTKLLNKKMGDPAVASSSPHVWTTLPLPVHVKIGKGTQKV